MDFCHFYQIKYFIGTIITKEFCPGGSKHQKTKKTVQGRNRADFRRHHSARLGEIYLKKAFPELKTPKNELTNEV